MKTWTIMALALLLGCDSLRGFMGPPTIVATVASTPAGLVFSFRECNGKAANLHRFLIWEGRAQDGQEVCRLVTRTRITAPLPATPFSWRYGSPLPGYVEEGPCAPLKPGEYVASRGLTFAIDADNNVKILQETYCPPTLPPGCGSSMIN